MEKADITVAYSISEDTFRSWAKGPGQTESDKAKNAENVICDALNEDAELAKLDIRVFTQGSYRARTNVRLDSDVDICIMLRSTIFYNLPANTTAQDVGLTASSYTFSEFKEEVGAALLRKFGKAGVSRGNKAFDVHANTYRIDADVVPTFEYRRYMPRQYAGGPFNYSLGVKFYADDGISYQNWPDQCYENGVTKNTATARRYKRVIRILKRLRNQMQDDEVSAADNIASFLIESLVWNAPDTAFFSDLYTDDVRSVLAHTFNDTMSQEKCDEWGEVNELKYLFRSSQPWTRQQAHDFLSAAWDYIGFD